MVTSPINFYNKRLERDSITDENKKNMVDYFCSICDIFYSDWIRIQENYALKNNQLDRENYAEICKGLGSEKQAEMFINAYNHSHNIIEQLKGDEWSRPFSFDVINLNPQVANRIERMKRMDLEKYLEKIFAIEIMKVKKFIDLEIEAQAGNIPPEQAEDAKKQISEEIAKKYNDLPTIKSIYNKYSNISTVEEISISKIMRVLNKKYNLKNLKNQTFEDLTISAMEFVEIYQDRPNQLPKVRALNPLNVFYEKSPDVQFIQDGDYAGYKEYITVTEAVGRYGEYLSDEDFERLTAGNFTHGINGLNQRMHHNRDAPSIDREVNRTNRMNGFNGTQYEDFFSNDPQFGGPEFGHVARMYNSTVGLSASPHRRNYVNFLNCYTVYWKAQRKIGVLTFSNEFDEIDEIIVGEDFVVPKRATKEKKNVGNSFNKRDLYTWYDDNDKRYDLYWIWVPEVWKGVRLGADIYVEIGPVKHAYQSLLNPYEVKLPIHGVIYNNRNSFAVSTMDRIKPWQKIYYVIMARFLKLLSQDKGVWTFLNVHLFDSNLGVEKTMQIAEDNSTLLYNPLSNAKGTSQLGLTNTMKVAERLDLSNANLIQHYTQILQFLEENMMKVSGMSAQRMAQSNPRMTASDNHRENQFSFNMTESLYVTHDLMWEKVLQTMMEMTLDVLKEDSGLVRGLLGDDEKTLIDLSILTLEDNFVLQVGDNSKAYRIMEQAMQLSHALIQNDKATFASLIDMMRAENLSELRQMIKDAEADFEQKMMHQQEQQQNHEKEMEQMKLQALENEQISKLDVEYLRGIMAHKKQEMKSQYDNMSFDEQKDHNSDGVPDYMQLAQLQQRINNETMKNNLEKEKIELEKAKAIDELDMKREELNSKRADKEADLEEKRKDRENKHRIEKAKLNNKSK